MIFVVQFIVLASCLMLLLLYVNILVIDIVLTQVLSRSEAEEVKAWFSSVSSKSRQ